MTTLFHEFGHGLHHLLTRSTTSASSASPASSGMRSSCPASSENLCWEWEVLQQPVGPMSTAATLPRALFDRMLAAKNFHSGCADAAPGGVRADRHAPACRAGNADRIARSGRRGARRGVAVLATPPFNRFLHTSRIFRRRVRGGLLQLQMGQVLSADAWGALRNRRQRRARAGHCPPARYRQIDASKPAAAAGAMESFRPSAAADRHRRVAPPGASPTASRPRREQLRRRLPRAGAGLPLQRQAGRRRVSTTTTHRSAGRRFAPPWLSCRADGPAGRGRSKGRRSGRQGDLHRPTAGPGLRPHQPVNAAPGAPNPMPCCRSSCAGRPAASRSRWHRTSGCEPCDDARALLRQARHPARRAQVLSREDSDALQKLTGGREMPVLAIGGQQLKGLTPTPGTATSTGRLSRESRLPAS